MNAEQANALLSLMADLYLVITQTNAAPSTENSNTNVVSTPAPFVEE